MKSLSSMECWLSDLRHFFITTHPALISFYDTYSAEAIFGRHFIASDLEKLLPGSKILEVGAGSLLLSCQLVREGFQVTALEPIGVGFSHFSQMRQIVTAKATRQHCLPMSTNIPIENFTEISTFDYAFSINVMEHVDDLSIAIRNISNSLKTGASYHFTAPNYLFPYEPHFNLPTLISKQLTKKVFNRRIVDSKNVSNPEETWNSLNWITTIQVRKIVGQLPKLEARFNRNIFEKTIERIATDQIFANRRSPLIRKILLLLRKYQFHKLLRYIPVDLQPIIDCRLQRH